MFPDNVVVNVAIAIQLSFADTINFEKDVIRVSRPIKCHQ